MVRKLGINDPQKAIGKEMRLLIPSWQRIVGVVKDFKTNSLREEVKPLVITANLKYSSRTAIKVNTAHFSSTIASIRQLWETNFPDYVRNDYFIDEHIAQFYNQENQLALIYKVFAGLAIFISCLGLYGLVSFMAMQKTREVGIRKVLGASAASIVYLFSREFTLLIAAAFLIATPVAWYLMNDWLNNFAYRIHLGAGVFIVALLSSILIAWFTVGYKAIRAALANPVKSLRSE
jgi:ABC-type antimicrobial peptide transport system permease subunit